MHSQIRWAQNSEKTIFQIFWLFMVNIRFEVNPINEAKYTYDFGYKISIKFGLAQ